MGPDQIPANPALVHMLQHLHPLVAQIKAQADIEAALVKQTQKYEGEAVKIMPNTKNQQKLKFSNALDNYGWSIRTTQISQKFAD